MSADTLTASLARFVVRSAWSELPESVRRAAKRCLLNFLGTALGGSQDEAIERAVGVLTALSGPAHASLIGRGERVDMLTAAFINAASANVLDFDDTHHPTVVHPTAPVAAPLLAWAQKSPVTGEALLHALALGIEIACRLGNVVTPTHYVRGWHITSTCGVVGAAAACAKLAQLDEARTIWALGLAANQACGLVESLGSMAKSVSVGNAARNGLLSALLAQRDFTAAAATLEGPRGFARVLADAPDLAAMTHRLGDHWEIERNMIKPYPSGVVLHPVVDACLALRRDHGIRPETIERVSVRGNPLLRQRADRPAPRSGREAAVSAQHTVAVCFLHGRAGVREYADECVKDPAVQALGARVSVEDDERIAVEAADVSVLVAGGARLDQRIDHALGSLARPLDDAQIEAKVRDLAAYRGLSDAIGRWIDALRDLEHAPDAARALRLE